MKIFFIVVAIARFPAFFAGASLIERVLCHLLI